MVAPRFRRDGTLACLRGHDFTLHGDRVVLRPMTEDDWDDLLRWNNDPDVMRYADAGPFQVSTLANIQQIYRWVSTHALCFVIEFDGAPIGECWLQQMNLQRILDQFPEKDLRRIDIMIGEKDKWGHGLGTEAVSLLTDFAFRDESADAIFAAGIADDNLRSRRAFEKSGFALHSVVTGTEDVGHEVGHDLVLWRDRYRRRGTR